MEHYGFTAREAIGWMRCNRNGMVIGIQSSWLINNDHFRPISQHRTPSRRERPTEFFSKRSVRYEESDRDLPSKSVDMSGSINRYASQSKNKYYDSINRATTPKKKSIMENNFMASNTFSNFYKSVDNTPANRLSRRNPPESKAAQELGEKAWQVGNLYNFGVMNSIPNQKSYFSGNRGIDPVDTNSKYKRSANGSTTQPINSRSNIISYATPKRFDVNYEPRSAYLSPPKKFEPPFEPRSAYLSPPKKFDAISYQSEYRSPPKKFNPTLEPKSVAYFSKKYQDITRNCKRNDEPSVSEFNTNKSMNFTADNFYSKKNHFNHNFSQGSTDFMNTKTNPTYDMNPRDSKFMSNGFKSKDIFGPSTNNQYLDDLRSRFRRVKQFDD